MLSSHLKHVLAPSLDGSYGASEEVPGSPNPQGVLVPAPGRRIHLYLPEKQVSRAASSLTDMGLDEKCL